MGSKYFSWGSLTKATPAVSLVFIPVPTFIMRRFIVPTLVLVAVLTGGGRAEETATLRAELERVYHEWRGAMLNRNVQAWQKSTSRYRQVHTHNMIVSQRQPYPEAVFAVPLRPPDITKLKMLEVEAIGDTAHLVYFGRIDLGIEVDEVPENLLVLRYIKDPDGWRFDTSRLVNLQGALDVRASLKEGGKATFLDEPEFTPPGKAPPVPAVCKVPQYVGAFQLESIGYETRVRVNGFDYPPVRDVAINQLIIGGLDRDENELELSITPTEVPPGEERSLEISVMVVPGDAEQKPVPVYRWKTTEAVPPPVKKVLVWVNNSTLKK